MPLLTGPLINILENKYFIAINLATSECSYVVFAQHRRAGIAASAGPLCGREESDAMSLAGEIVAEQIFRIRF